jgi:hypothetical protein
VQQYGGGPVGPATAHRSYSRLVGCIHGSHEEPNSISWNEFNAIFCSHHVPQGIIKLKKKEFQDLKQGSMTMSEYVTCFTQLSCYAPNNVDTDEKK